MNIKGVHIFKFSFLIGLILLFLSVFVEWYSYQIFTLEQELIVSWKYNIFWEWSSIFSDSPLNEALRPENLSISVPLNIIFLCFLFLSGYVILFKDIERVDSIIKYRPYSYVLGITLILNIFYVVVFPVMYLFPQELYFPFIQIVDYEQDFMYLYSIDIGYVLQLIAFMLIFPFPIHYFRTIYTFDNEKNNPETYLKNKIQDAQEPLDLDKLIAQEELKFQNSDRTIQEDDLNEIINLFIEGDS